MKKGNEYSYTSEFDRDYVYLNEWNLIIFPAETELRLSTLVPVNMAC